jgi:hypothetical protein
VCGGALLAQKIPCTVLEELLLLSQTEIHVAGSFVLSR